MDRFVVRELRSGAEFPQGNQMIAFPGNTGGTNITPPETMYLSGPFANEFPNAQQNIVIQHDMNVQHNMSALNNTHVQHNMAAYQNMSLQYNMEGPQNINIRRNMNVQHINGAQHNTGAQQNLGDQHNIIMGAQRALNGQHNLGAQRAMNGQHNVDAQRAINGQHNIGAHNIITQQNLDPQYRMGAQHNINPQMTHGFVQNPVTGHTGQGPASGIDPTYLAGFADNSARYIVTGQQIQRNATPITRNCSFGSDYESRNFNGIDRNKPKSFVPQISFESSKVGAKPKPQPQQLVSSNSNKENVQQNYPAMPQSKKTNELDLLKNDVQNQIVSRADKLKNLRKSGPRAFSGPVEKVLKWHKSLQDIGLLILYEIVAKCVSVRLGKSGSKVLVVRDDSGPAMQVVYYEIDFLLPELKLPCTVRVVGRMMPGTCSLQAFNVRPATGDDVATLPRRAAVAAHHVAKLCKEYGT